MLLVFIYLKCHRICESNAEEGNRDSGQRSEMGKKRWFDLCRAMQNKIEMGGWVGGGGQKGLMGRLGSGGGVGIWVLAGEWNAFLTSTRAMP